jgi:putative FmdB family regulatory protein
MLQLSFDCMERGAPVPLYEYKCRKCGRLTEKIENVSGPHLKKCPHCGGKVEAVITAPSIQFKGGGWYVTDYGGKSTDGGSKTEKPAGETKETPAKDSSAKESSAKESSAKESSGKESPSKESSEKKPAKKK